MLARSSAMVGSASGYCTLQVVSRVEGSAGGQRAGRASGHCGGRLIARSICQIEPGGACERATVAGSGLGVPQSAARRASARYQRQQAVRRRHLDRHHAVLGPLRARQLKIYWRPAGAGHRCARVCVRVQQLTAQTMPQATPAVPRAAAHPAPAPQHSAATSSPPAGRNVGRVSAAAAQQVPHGAQEGAVAAPPPRAPQLGLVDLRGRGGTEWGAAAGRQGTGARQRHHAVSSGGGTHIPRTTYPAPALPPAPKGSPGRWRRSPAAVSRSIHSNSASRGAPSSRSITARACAAGIGGTCAAVCAVDGAQLGQLPCACSPRHAARPAARPAAQPQLGGAQQRRQPQHTSPAAGTPGHAAGTACGRSVPAQSRRAHR